MPTIEYRTIGATGRNHTTLADFGSWLLSQDLVATDRIIIARVYDNLTVSATTELYPATYDVTRYCRVMPAPGLGVNDLSPTGAMDYGTQGVEITVNRGVALRLNPGIYFEGFRVYLKNGTSTSTAAPVVGKLRTANETIPSVFRFNRVKSDLADTTVSGIDAGSSSSWMDVSDNLFVQDSGTAYFINLSAHSYVRRNTFVRRSTSVGSSAIFAGNFTVNQSCVISDDVFVGCGNRPMNSTGGAAGRATVLLANIYNNYTDTAVDSAVDSASKYTVSSNLIVGANDARPAAGSPVIGAGSATGYDSFDMRNFYRGTAPDAGAFQATSQALPAVAVAAITSQALGALSITLSGTYSGTVSSASATVSPAASNPGGAGTYTKAVSFASGSWSVQFTGMAAGNYAAPVITFTNSGGVAAASGGSAFALVTPEVPAITVTGRYVLGSRVAITGTVTGAPTTMSATLSPAATPNGAVSATVSATINADGTFTAEFSGLANGNYLAPALSATGAGGTGTYGVGSGITISVAAPAPVAGTIYRTIGPYAWCTDATLIAFGNWLKLQDLPVQNVKVIAYVYDHQPIANTQYAKLIAANASETCNCIVRPAPGMSAIDLNASGPLYYNKYLGIEVEARCSTPIDVGCGVSFEGFLIKLLDSTNTSGAFRLYTGVHSGSAELAFHFFRYNRVLSKNTGPGPVVSGGGTGINPTICDNLFISDSGSAPLIELLYTGKIRRNTIYKTGAAAGSLGIKLNQSYDVVTAVDSNLLLGCGSAPISNIKSKSLVVANVTDTAPAVATSGIIDASASAPLIIGSTDLRLRSGTEAVGGGSVYGVSTLDIVGSNRGLIPDVGAHQLNPDQPLPGLTITAVVVNGQTVTVSGTSTGSPTSGSASMAPASSDVGTAVQQGPTSLTLGNGTFSVQWQGVPAGEYQTPVITAVNVGGVSPVASGGSPVSILGIAGTDAYAATSGPAVPTITSIVASGQHFVLQGTATNAPFAGTVTLKNASGSLVQGPYALLVENSTFSLDLDDLTPGDYTALVFALENLTSVTSTELSASVGLVLVVRGSLAVQDAIADEVAMVGSMSPPIIYGSMAVSDSVQDTVDATATLVRLPKKVRLRLTTNGSAPAAGISGLKVAFFDRARPDLLDTAPSVRADGVSLDADGWLDFDVTGTDVPFGTVGSILVTNSDGTVGMDHRAFFGPVVVLDASQEG